MVYFVISSDKASLIKTSRTEATRLKSSQIGELLAKPFSKQGTTLKPFLTIYENTVCTGSGAPNYLVRLFVIPILLQLPTHL